MVIIGAGVIGCACAFELASAGAHVTVFDARQVGQGASQASAGVLAPYIEGHQSSALCTLGRLSLDLYDAFIARLNSANGSVIEYTRGGTLEVAFDTDHADNLRRSAQALAAEGVSATWLDPHALAEAEPLTSRAALGGLLIPMHGFVGVSEFTEALASAALRTGARVAAESRVIAVDRTSDGRLRVQTENGSTTADRVVLAAGSWASQIQIAGVDTPLGVRPVRGQLLHLAWPTPQPLCHVLWGPHCYIVPWRNGRVLVGATVEDAGFDERATAEGVHDLLGAACALVPQMWQASFQEVRVGLRPASPDDLPIVGVSQQVPGLIYATGHFRNGVLLTPLTAALVTDLVLGRRPDVALDALSPARLGRL